MLAVETEKDLLCYHCGQACTDEILWSDDKPFCCQGCKTVFEILNANNLCEYYNLDKNPGVPISATSEQNFAYLDEGVIRKKVLTFDSADFSKVEFYIPTIHCVSCIWLLENLKKLERGVLRSEVNFAQKKVSIDFNPQQVKLSRLAALLTSVGYVPQISLDAEKTQPQKIDRSLVIKLSVAGFVFGNIMLFSFPEYLGLDQTDHSLMRLFSWLNLVLSWPVFFYSGWGYMQAAFASFRQKQINIDVPIAAGLIALFARSHYDIISATGPGYLDSFTGLVFFLLIGRWFQSKTYESLSFERDFKSYFPLAVSRFRDGDWKPVVIYELKKDDRIRIRNMEIIPTDALLEAETTYVDYSFVTGESRPVKVKAGELVYAGGRLIGQPVTLIVQAATSQSHLTSLWNNEAFRKREESQYQKIIDRAARRFTWIVMVFAVATGLYWYVTNTSEMWLVVTAVLMVACPCALALAAPFTYGSMLRAFGRNQLYLKNADVIERMAAIDAVVFDKTGTVTYSLQPEVKLIGYLIKNERTWVKALTNGSTHPLSSKISKSISGTPSATIKNFRELPGQGIEGEIEDHLIKIGSADFTGMNAVQNPSASHVYVSIDGEPRGYFSISLSIRDNLKPMLNRLGHKCEAVLSGDNDKDLNKMKLLFGCNVNILFNQSPHDKLEFIRNIQRNGKKVLMVGDGLNDAGALKQADVGIAVTEDTGVFTPACDGILTGNKLEALDKLLELAKSSTIILKTGFVISFMYNAIALTVAATGHLTPLVAAILMPISSVSVVGFSSLAVRYVVNRKLKQV
jgi:P-type Cu+ transporter